MHGDAGPRSQAIAQRFRERAHAGRDRVEPDRERVLGRRAEAEICAPVALPLLETANVGSQLVGAGRGPVGGAEVDDVGFQALDPVGGDVEKAGAARSAQELAARRREERASDRTDVDRELADRLARVEQIRDPGAGEHGAHRRRRVDEPTRGGNVRDRDQADPLVEHRRERVDIDLAGAGARYDFDSRAGSPRDLQHRDEVARVLDTMGEDPVAGLKGHRVEDLVPRACRALRERDLSVRRTHEAGERGRRRGNRLGLLLGRFVAADARLELQVVDHRVEHRRRLERRAGVVEVNDMLAARRLGACPRDIDRTVDRTVDRAQRSSGPLRRVTPPSAPACSPRSMKTSPFTRVAS